MSLFNRNIQEIIESKRISTYGIFLSVSHLLTAFFLYRTNFSIDGLVCWQFFSGCQPFTRILFLGLSNALIIYGALSTICAGLFFLKKQKIAYYLFLTLSLFKIIVQLSDYRFMGNYHYMSNIINFAFLFLPCKKDIIKLFIVLFYMAAGVIKFNLDWFSGAALTNPSVLSGRWLILSCAYVVLLELVLSLGLLSKNKKYFYFVLVQVCLFHLFSWHIVGYFYPLIMFSLISIYFLSTETFVFPTQRINLFFVGLFLFAQMLPLFFDLNSSLTNKYRVYALNMLDAYSQCETRLFLKNKDSTIEYRPDFSKIVVRLHCDPIFIVQKVHETCDYYKTNANFKDIDFDFQVRRSSEQNNIQQLTLQNVCSHPLKIDALSGAAYQ